MWISVMCAEFVFGSHIALREQEHWVLYFFSEMVTLPNSPCPSSTASAAIDIETDTDYLKTAKKGGGHKGNWMTNNYSVCHPLFDNMLWQGFTYNNN